MGNEQKTDSLYVSAMEVLKYLDDMTSVLSSIVEGIEDSKTTLLEKVEDHKKESKDESIKGETNDGE